MSLIILFLSLACKNERVYDYDYILYFPELCKKCNLIRPARSRHCDLCGKCIIRMHHHCFLSRKCIGAHNFKSFALFLLNSCLIVSKYSSFCCFFLSLYTFLVLFLNIVFNVTFYEVSKIHYLKKGLIEANVYFYLKDKQLYLDDVNHDQKYIHMYNLGIINNFVDLFVK